MKYKSGAAFRQALEQRLLNRSRATGTSLVRLRKAVVFDRLLALHRDSGASPVSRHAWNMGQRETSGFFARQPRARMTDEA